MKQLYIILLASISVCNYCNAQKTPVKPIRQVVKDTFTLKLLSSIDIVVKMATNEKITGRGMVGEFIGSTSGRFNEYQSAVQVPGSSKTICTQHYTNRNRGITVWKWQTSIPVSTTGSQTLESAKEKAEKVMRSFKIDSLKYKGEKFSYGVNELENELQLSIDFYKGLHNTEQEAVDSLEQLYMPLLVNPQTAEEYAKLFERAFEIENISKNIIQTSYKKLIKQVADKSTKAAFNIMIAISSNENFKLMKEALTTTQQEEIKTMAKKVVNDYYDNQKIQFEKNNPAVAPKKEIEKEIPKPPTDPCARQIWELKFKPDSYVSSNGYVGKIINYSCDNKLYTIAWFDANAKKIKLAKNVSVAATSEYSLAYNAPFMLCRNCNGEGFRLEYDWVQMNSYSGHYARTDKQRKIPCGECGSRGCHIIR